MFNYHLSPYIKKYFKNLAFGLICLGLVSLINLSIPLVIKEFITDLSANQNAEVSSSIRTYAIALLGVFALQGLLGFFRIHQFNLFAAKYIKDLKNNIFSSLLAKPVSFHEKLKTGDFISKLNADTQIVQEVIATKLSVAIRYAIQVLGGIILLFIVSIKLSVLIIFFLPFLVVISLVLAKKLKSFSFEIQRLQGSVGNLTEEAIRGFKTIKVFQALGKIENIFQARIENIFQTTVSRSKLSAFFQSFVSFLLYSFIVCFLAYGIYLTRIGALNYPDLSSFIMYAILVAVSFSLLSSVIDDITKAMGAYQRISDLILDSKFNHDDIAIAPDPITSDIIVDKLSYGYQEHELVLEKISFKLSKNEINILTGGNGSGKSTFLNLLLGFEDTFTGDILINDKSINQTNLKGYFSFVAQQPLILDLNIRDNITLLNSDIDDSAILAILQEIGGDFILELDSGLDTLCGNNGTQLSGGQQQLIALTRAIISEAPIMVLDEATSALDNQREKLVLAKLQAMACNQKTIVMVSHKLEIIKNADNLIIFEDNGSIQANKYESLQHNSTYLRRIMNVCL